MYWMLTKVYFEYSRCWLLIVTLSFHHCSELIWKFWADIESIAMLLFVCYLSLLLAECRVVGMKADNRRREMKWNMDTFGSMNDTFQSQKEFWRGQRCAPGVRSQWRLMCSCCLFKLELRKTLSPGRGKSSRVWYDVPNVAGFDTSAAI